MFQCRDKGVNNFNATFTNPYLCCDKNSDFLVLYTNADGLLNKKGEFETIVMNLQPKIIAVTEIKAKRQQDLEYVEYALPGYTLFVNSKPKLGVALFMKDSLNAVECIELNNNDFQESVWCSFKSNRDEEVLVGCIYKSPNSDLENVEKLHKLLLNDRIKSYDKTLIVGDFNYPTVNWNGDWSSTKDEVFLECIRDAFLHQMVVYPTRHREGQRPTLDDLILVSDEQLVSDIVHYSPIGKSDHDVLLFQLYINERETEKVDFADFDLGKGNYNKMKEELGRRDWGSLADMNVEDGWLVVKNTILESMRENIPRRKVSINKKASKPVWMNNKVKKIVGKKQSFYKRYLKLKTSIDYEKYVEVRNKCNRIIKQAKRDYEQKLATDCKRNPKYFWKYVQSKINLVSGVSSLNRGDGSLVIDDKDKADVLNSFFASVFVKENTDNIISADEGSMSNFGFISEIIITPLAVLQKLKNLNVNKAQGPDGIPPRILKELCEQLANPLSVLFNKSLEEGKIPSDWKKADVVPIFKKGTRADPGNYRPVSLTCILSKVLESFVRDALVSHMMDNKLYSSCQHGFRKHRSCVTQLLEVMEHFTDFYDNGNSFDVIYFDFKKAFDSVPHQRLLIKLAAYGITGTVHNWIKEFLSGRVQRVRVGKEFSTLEPVLSGIPQGSILGPILFTIFINDISENIQSYCRIFADDTKIYNLTSDCKVLQEDVYRLQEWSAKWELHFNVSKCKVLHAGKKNPNFNYVMKTERGISEMDVCEEEKDLGVIFDGGLRFDSHIQSSINKANKIIGIIRRSFSFLNKDSFLRLYKALVRPHLEYGNSIWAPHLKRQSVAIERVQRRATRLLPEIKDWEYERRMKFLNLPSLKYRRYRGDLIQTFKIINKVDDLRCDDFYLFNGHNITRQSDINLQVRHCSTDMKKFSFSYRTTRYWNALSRETKMAVDINMFKNLLDKDSNRDILSYEFDSTAKVTRRPLVTKMGHPKAARPSAKRTALPL